MLVHRERIGLLGRVALGAALLVSVVSVSHEALAVPTAICSASDSNSRTGRQYAKVSESPRPVGRCIREKLGGEAPPGVPDCWAAARDAGFFCTEIIDIN